MFEERGRPLPLWFCNDMIRQGLGGGVGKKIERKGVRGIVAWEDGRREDRI